MEKAIEEVLVENIQGRFLASVRFYKGNATVSLQIMDLDTNFTKGLLALEREKALKELKEKGLDRKNKQLTISDFPLKIGLITAEGSRAMSDFLDQLYTYKYPGEVILYPSHMQGETTLKEVVAGLKALSKLNLDAIVLTRGGGSAADLRWFDSPEIAYALSECSMPVISAIGHHDDVCVAELISYHREKTPTAAADFLISKIAETSTKLTAYSTRLSKLLDAHQAHALKIISRLQTELLKQSFDRLSSKERMISHKKELLFRAQAYSFDQKTSNLDSLKYKLSESYQRRNQWWQNTLSSLSYSLQKSSEPRIYKEKEKLDRIKNQINLLVQGLISSKQSKLQNMESSLTSKDPSHWIKEGWTQLSSNGEKLRKVENLNIGDILDARLKDGSLKLKIEKIIRK